MSRVEPNARANQLLHADCLLFVQSLERETVKNVGMLPTITPSEEMTLTSHGQIDGLPVLLLQLMAVVAKAAGRSEPISVDSR